MSHLESLSREELIVRVSELEAQLRWFQKQIFGRKSERRLAGDSKYIQLTLGSLLEEETPPISSVPSHSKNSSTTGSDRSRRARRIASDSHSRIDSSISLASKRTTLSLVLRTRLYAQALFVGKGKGEASTLPETNSRNLAALSDSLPLSG